MENYGFTANDNKTAKTNSTRIIGDKNKNEHFNEFNNMAFHDLTVHNEPSMDTNTLLGLGPKFCIQPREVQLGNTMRMIGMFKRYVRLKGYLMPNIFDENDEIPRLSKNT